MKYIFKTTHFISFPIQYLDPVSKPLSPNVEINKKLPLASAYGMYCVVYKKYIFKISLVSSYIAFTYKI